MSVPLPLAERGAWLLSGVGLLGSAVVWVVAPSLFPHAWLAALTFWLGWPLGSMALVLIHALTGGSWGYAIRPQLTTGIEAMPLFVPALVPILLVLPALYPWMHAEVAAGLVNRFYLNAPFFYLRCGIYVVVWLGLARVVLRALRRAAPQQPVLYRVAPPGLIVLALTVTFAAIDFTLSLDPHFESSVYGMLAASEAVLLALSGAVFMLTFARPRELGQSRDLGKLVFALVILWAYLDFMQLLIVWNSNLPSEAHWYAPRLGGLWGVMALAIAALHFALPFFALLCPVIQRSSSGLRALTGLLVVTEVPRAWWIVIPAAGRSLSFWDAVPMLAMLGLASAMALRAIRRAPAAGVSEVAAHG